MRTTSVRAEKGGDMPHDVEYYGWVADLPDSRDHFYSAPAPVRSTLPTRTDLRPQCPPVYDQGPIGSCTGNAVAAAIEFDRKKQSLPDFVSSRLFIYYNERVIEHTTQSDSGAQIRDGIKTIATQGACNEGNSNNEWPYLTNLVTERPRPACYDAALKYRAVEYQRIVRDLAQMKSCLASGYPFVFGFTVYQSFEDEEVAHTGHAPMPTPQEAVVGGHAVLAVGYDDANGTFLVRNSWGTDWGMEGYFTLPYDYLRQPQLSDDFWTVRVVS